MSAAAGPVHLTDAKADTKNTTAGVRKLPAKGSKPHDSYLLRYQELKHMRENKNPPVNQNQQQSHDTEKYAPDGEMPQISKELDDKNASKIKEKKSKLCVIL